MLQLYDHSNYLPRTHIAGSIPPAYNLERQLLYILQLGQL